MNPPCVPSIHPFLQNAIVVSLLIITGLLAGFSYGLVVGRFFDRTVGRLVLYLKSRMLSKEVR